MNDSKYRRYMLKEAKDNVPVFFKPIELTSKRGNKYILQINSKGRSDYKKRWANVFYCLCTIIDQKVYMQ